MKKTSKHLPFFTLSMLTFETLTLTYVTLWSAGLCLLAANVESTLLQPKELNEYGNDTCNSEECYNGYCVNRKCICYEGWQGSNCRYCTGKIRLTESRGLIYPSIGNYTTNQKCSWLIESASNTTIRLRIENFETECGWDHLYIYDGNNVEAPLLAAFSGLIDENLELVTTANEVLIHFSSDAYHVTKGFNISYAIDYCSSSLSRLECSGHGKCTEGKCVCSDGWKGKDCNAVICPNNCSLHLNHGRCDTIRGECQCSDEYQGKDCSEKRGHESWEVVRPYDYFESTRSAAGHCSILWENSIYIIGGINTQKQEFMLRYKLDDNVISSPILSNSKKQPLPRYAHSCIRVGNKIYMYGGSIIYTIETDEMWTYELGRNNSSWKRIYANSNCLKHKMCSPLKVSGHTANLIKEPDGYEKMLVIFGYSSEFGYLNTVQEYNVRTQDWQIVETHGFPVKGTYGHTSVYDVSSNLVYVFGGFGLYDSLLNDVTNRIYSYDTVNHEWKLLTPAPSARYLHSAVFVSDSMILFFSGKTRPTTGEKCVSNDMLVYDLVHDTWERHATPGKIDYSRYGHSANVYGNFMHIFGGFNGQIMTSALRYMLGNCTDIKNIHECHKKKIGYICNWDKMNQLCLPKPIPSDYQSYTHYLKAARVNETSKFCAHLTDCASCVQTSNDCIWCGKNCSYRICENDIDAIDSSYFESISSLRMCPTNDHTECELLHTCQACEKNEKCTWSVFNDEKCIPVSENIKINVENKEKPYSANNICSSYCAEYTSCGNCTESTNCVWCQNEEKCISKSTYPINFPYGQCRDWTLDKETCLPTTLKKEWCNGYQNCSSCQTDAACGWCDDGSETGTGKCIHGGFKGSSSGSSEFCPSHHWHFTECPSCQCNGHSSCYSNSTECLQPCTNSTSGLHCETCKSGYFGNPLNGGTCKPCSCNDHGEICDNLSGKCLCTTYGVIGDHCDECDKKFYFGDPINDTCFMDLLINYQYTINMSKENSLHYKAVNFKCTTPKADRSTFFYIKCSAYAKIGIKTMLNNFESSFFNDIDCTNVEYRYHFQKTNYNVFIAGDSGSYINDLKKTFYVYVYNLKPPLYITISFGQLPSIFD